MRRQVPILLCGIVGILLIIQFFVPHPISEGFLDKSNDWFRILTIFAFVIGIGSLIRVHIHRISRRSEDWYYSIAVFVGMLIMPLVALIDSIRAGKFVTDSAGFEWFYFNFYVPLDATIFSLLAFFIASAAYRAFRARTLDATLLLLAGIALMVANAPFGNIFWNATLGQLSFLPEGFPTILGDWILEVPGMAARRGILIGLALGAISQSLRILLGIDRAWMGG